MNPLLLVDYYKVEHHKMYTPGCSRIYSNWTPRKSRLGGIPEVVVFWIQYLIVKYLIEDFNTYFFKRPLQEVLDEYSFAVKGDLSHIEALHTLGYLPLRIKALPEGTLCPIGVPMLTMTNTIPEFFWLVNYLETLLSCVLWQPMTSASIAYRFRKSQNHYAGLTVGSTDGVQYSGHDFSLRGMSSPASGSSSGSGHLLSYEGSDTVPALYDLFKYYGAAQPAGGSVPATEHSVQCLDGQGKELETFRRLLSLYPEGILSIVSDTWDLWKVCTEYLTTLKPQILARAGKLVIRPDSGDPVRIMTGYLPSEVFIEGDTIYLKDYNGNRFVKGEEISRNEYKGVIELLYDVFGGTKSEHGYIVLDSHIGAIYGDSITQERMVEINERLMKKGFATTNWVAGIGLN